MDVALVPPFTLETARAKVRKVEDGWNSRNPEQVALAYTVDSLWRNRAEFVNGKQSSLFSKENGATSSTID